MIPHFLFRFDRLHDDVVLDTLVAFAGTADLHAIELRMAIEKEIVDGLRPDELIIIVRHPHYRELQTHLAPGGELYVLFERLGDRTTVNLISYDRHGWQCKREIIKQGHALSSLLTLDEIARRGMTRIFRERHGFVESTPSYHFENPSTHHTSRFIRLSNILTRQAEIAFIAASSLRFVGDARKIYVDTPALYPIVASINEQLASFDQQHRFISCDNFQSYNGFTDYPFGSTAGALVLISASSSGSLAKKLIDKAGFNKDQIAHILFLGSEPSKQNIVCDLAKEEGENPDGFANDREVYERDNCRLCRAGSKYIKLQGDQFDIAGPQPTPVMVRKIDAPKTLSRQMRGLGGKKIFQVGHKAEVRSRQFEVNVGKLLDDRDFLDRVAYFVERYLPARAEAAIYTDPSSQVFASHISNLAYDGRLKLVDHKDIDALVGQVRSSSAILIIGAVISSGRVFQNISRDLRNICPSSPLIYFAGYAQPENEERWTVLTNSLVETNGPARHGLIAVERLNLLERRENPWSLEAKWLGDRAFDQLDDVARGLIEVRKEVLRQASAPLVDNLYLAADGVSTMKAQKGFVFWPDQLLTKPENHSQADIFYTISGVLQELRGKTDVNDSKIIRTNWFQQSVLDPENFGRFNDGAIQASLLRAALSAELDYSSYPEVSAEAARIVRRIIESCSHPRGEAAVEFLIAMGCGRLKLAQPDYDDVLAPLSGAVPPLVEGLRKVVQTSIAMR